MQNALIESMVTAPRHIILTIAPGWSTLSQWFGQNETSPCYRIVVGLEESEARRVVRGAKE
jgi:hypothetical protein